MSKTNDLGVDITRAFTPKEQEAVNKLPRERWLAFMKRPNSMELMSEEERAKHYKSSNYPPVEYTKKGNVTGGRIKR